MKFKLGVNMSRKNIISMQWLMGELRPWEGPFVDGIREIVPPGLLLHNLLHPQRAPADDSLWWWANMQWLITKIHLKVVILENSSKQNWRKRPSTACYFRVRLWHLPNILETKALRGGGGVRDPSEGAPHPPTSAEPDWTLGFDLFVRKSPPQKDP